MFTITITYSEVITDVMRTLEYEGQKNGVFDKVRAIAHDRDQLRIFWQDAVANVSNVLDRVISRCTTTAYSNTNVDDIGADGFCDINLHGGMYDEEDYCDIDLPAGVNDADHLDGTYGIDVEDINEQVVIDLTVANDTAPIQLRLAIMRDMVSHIIVQWLRIVLPEFVQKYQSDEQVAHEQLSRMAYFREMP